MLSRFPELGTSRLGSTKTELIQPADAWGTLRLKLFSFWPRAGGRGTMGQHTFFGRNPPFNPSWTGHILMSTALFFCCKQISVLLSRLEANSLPLFMPVFVTAHWFADSSQILRRGKGKDMVWRGEHKDAFVSHMLEIDTVLSSFRDSIRNQEHQPCYQQFLDIITHAADATGMTARQMSRRIQPGLPWPLGMTQLAVGTSDGSDGTKTQPTFCWAATIILYVLQAEERSIKKENADMVTLVDTCSPEVYKLMSVKEKFWHFSHVCWVMDWAPSSTFCATPR
jgi:hypothetical protein